LLSSFFGCFVFYAGGGIIGNGREAYGPTTAGWQHKSSPHRHRSLCRYDEIKVLGLNNRFTVEFSAQSIERVRDAGDHRPENTSNARLQFIDAPLSH
jgi:hypothetical protein